MALPQPRLPAIGMGFHRARRQRDATPPAIPSARSLLLAEDLAPARQVVSPRLSWRAWVIVIAYSIAIVAAEAVVTFVSAGLGVLVHALVLLLLLNHVVMVLRRRAARAETPTPDREHGGVLLGLALVPLLRLLSLTVPVRGAPLLAWYAFAGVPLLVGIALTARFLGLSWSELGLRPRRWPVQLLIGVSGVPLGLLAFVLLRPQPLVATLAWRPLAIAALTLFIFAGLTEELLFRGLLRPLAWRVFGNFELVWTSLLFAGVYIASRSPVLVALMVALGLLWGWCVRRTGSLWGAVIAHGLFIVGLLLVWPLLGV